MTTHHRYGQEERIGAHAFVAHAPAPQQHPGPPPGAPADPPPPTYGAVTPYELPLLQHGGYLVTHPERLTDGRTAGPSVWPVAVFTLLFGVFGAICAHRLAGRARAVGGGTAAYWLTFGLVQGVMAVVLVLLVLAFALPADLAAR